MVRNIKILLFLRYAFKIFPVTSIGTSLNITLQSLELFLQHEGSDHIRKCEKISQKRLKI